LAEIISDTDISHPSLAHSTLKGASVKPAIGARKSGINFVSIKEAYHKNTQK
jgi:hypothetical protein